MKIALRLNHVALALGTSQQWRPWRCRLLVILLIFSIATLARLPAARAACNEGCDGPVSGNTFLGESALNPDLGQYNTAIGNLALVNTTASSNTAVGSHALGDNTIGDRNTAIGDSALVQCFAGTNNTAIGFNAMVGDGLNTLTGSNNTAAGYQTLFSCSTGSNNTASGYQALFTDTTGSSNVATGYSALFFNKTGSFNTATGRGALYKNTASNNTADGYQALNKNTVGIDNVASGYQALLVNTSGITNTAVGAFALDNSQTGAGNIAIGFAAGSGVTSGSNNIDIANNGANESSTIRIGSSNQTNTYIAGINGVTVAGGIGVIIDSNGHLGTITSSARYKENIQPMDNASEALLSLEPVTFRYKKELDPKAIPQFGLVAEQVEKVDPDLVARNEEGKPYAVRYEAVNAMLLNEFLKEHQTVERQEKKIEALELKLKEQAAQIQKVIAQSQLSQSSAPVAVNPR